MDDEQLYIEVPASTVNYVNRILEGYEYLGILTTINAKRATCVVHTTKDTRPLAIEVLKSIDDVPVKILRNVRRQNRRQAVRLQISRLEALHFSDYSFKGCVNHLMFTQPLNVWILIYMPLRVSTSSDS
mgnify:CR=1 FL=1